MSESNVVARVADDNIDIFKSSVSQSTQEVGNENRSDENINREDSSNLELDPTSESTMLPGGKWGQPDDNNDKAKDEKND